MIVFYHVFFKFIFFLIRLLGLMLSASTHFQVVRAFWLVCKCVFIALWSTKMTWAIWLTVSELWEFTVRASYIVCLFVKTESSNFIKEIKPVVRASIASWKPGQSLWKFSRIVDSVSGFHWFAGFRILPNVCLGFYQVMKARKQVLFLK